MGIPNADTYVFVYAENVASCATSGSSVIAYASSCQRDQYDRPTFGVINLCPQVGHDGTYVHACMCTIAPALSFKLNSQRLPWTTGTATGTGIQGDQ